MHRLHLARNLRSLAFLLATAAVIAGIIALWWLNSTGLPESWRAAIEWEIRNKQGINVQIGRLSYLPLRGVIASQVRIFADADQRQEISRLERVILEFDKTKLARGKVHLRKVELRDAQLVLPADPTDPNSTPVVVTAAHGTLVMPGDRRLEIRNARGRIAGLDVTLDARIVGDRRNNPSPADPSQAQQRRQWLTRITHLLNQWQFPPNQPPQLRVFLDHDANREAALTARLSLTAKTLTRNHQSLADLTINAEVAGPLVTLTTLQAHDAHGSLDAHLDYQIAERAGRFDARSSLELTSLLENWLGWQAPPWLRIAGTQTASTTGEFQLDNNNTPQVQLTGHARCEHVTLRDVPFASVSSAFSWRDGELFVRDLELRHTNGTMTGKAMIQGPLVRLAVESNIPPAVYQPFFRGQPLEKVCGDFNPRPDGRVVMKLEGGFNANEPKSWALTGSGRATHLTYRGVPINLAECQLALSAHELDFNTGTVIFNYHDYPLRKAFDGPEQGTVKVGRIRYDNRQKVVEVEDVVGAVWGAPLLRLFAPKVADSLEVYRFHRPPDLRGVGVIDVTDQGRTALEVGFNSAASADYRFLGETLTLDRPAGTVIIQGSRVTVDNLTLNAFDGPLHARFETRGNGQLAGDLSWTKLSLPALGATYGYQIKGGGTTTGRIDFTLTDGEVTTMQGDGLFAVEKTELLSVPMFGPLSPLISNVLNDRRAGFERAKDAFANFTIKDGILRSNDFRTTTTSLVFAGEGAVDLKHRTLDMTMRLNARGVLGLITLPLRPFYGMFQFRGTGPLQKPKWENVMFTAPPAEQSDLLLAAPKARVVTAPND